MAMTTEPVKGRGKYKSGKVTINGTLTIYDAVAGKQSLLDALSAVNQLEIDLSGVTEIDTAGVQLLVMLKRTSASSKKSVQLVAHSPASLGVLDQFNLVGYFGDPVVITSRRANRERTPS